MLFPHTSCVGVHVELQALKWFMGHTIFLNRDYGKLSQVEKVRRPQNEAAKTQSYGEKTLDKDVEMEAKA